MEFNIDLDKSPFNRTADLTDFSFSTKSECKNNMTNSIGSNSSDYSTYGNL